MNIEDGVALADDSLRAELASRFPTGWPRIEVRGSFMADTLGINVHPDVLPLSKIAAHLAPFLLKADWAMALVA